MLNGLFLTTRFYERSFPHSDAGALRAQDWSFWGLGGQCLRLEERTMAVIARVAAKMQGKTDEDPASGTKSPAVGRHTRVTALGSTILKTRKRSMATFNCCIHTTMIRGSTIRDNENGLLRMVDM